MDERAKNLTESTAFQQSPTAVATARESVASAGAHLMPAATVRAYAGAGEEEWARFAAYWRTCPETRTPPNAAPADCAATDSSRSPTEIDADRPRAI
ncbi:hypothetical protein ABZ851_16320 [Streptomyces sp. NPDC047049]|uniref:hypothetical protein n=1 Tax=Streptomyces sp. NPDC047049 TaxID=3156688 RepID=UPI0033E21969